MRVEVINTGSELLLGQVTNTHLGYFSEQLLPLGLVIERQHTLPDGDIIGSVLDECLKRADVILITGGLGPTSDDITRDLVAARCGVPLEIHPEIEEKILGFFARRRLPAPDMVKVQAQIPRGALILQNNHGTAPGFILTHQEKHIICLPGPPRELIPMFEEQVIPFLRSLMQDATPLGVKTLRIFGIGESKVQQRVEDKLRELGPLEIGYCSRPGEVDLRLISKDTQLLAKATDLTRHVFGEDIYAEDDGSMEQTVISLATRLGKSIATAESCTGGLVAHRLTNIPGSSAVLNRSWVTYSNQSKAEELGVLEETLACHGAVSAETAREMAKGALEAAGVDLAVSVTGIAGPGGGTEEKPVGLVFLGLAVKSPSGEVTVKSTEKRLVPQREVFKTMASQNALDMLRRALYQTQNHQ